MQLEGRELRSLTSFRVVVEPVNNSVQLPGYLSMAYVRERFRFRLIR